MAKHRMRDVVVVLPGITGSALSEVNGARTTPIWNLSGGAMWQFLRSRGGSLETLRVDTHDPRHAPPSGCIVATGLVAGFHGVFGLTKIDGYGEMLDEINRRFDLTVGRWDDNKPANLLPFPYDWRLSNRVAAAALNTVLTTKLRAWRDAIDEPDAKVIVVAHSMGGLVARYWLEVLGGWKQCRALVTFGTPFQGSVDAVGYVANGYKKAFVNLTDVLRSCPSVYELLPVYRVIRHDGGWHVPVDVAIPCAVDDYVKAAAEFHNEIIRAHSENLKDPAYLADRYAVLPYVGVHQTTNQSARLDGNKLVIGRALPEWIDTDLEGGDGTVPRASATPEEIDLNPFAATFLGEQHGSLQNNAHALDDLIERIRQSQVKAIREVQGSWKPRLRSIDMVVDDLVLVGEPVTIEARGVSTDGAATLDFGLRATISSETDPLALPRGWSSAMVSTSSRPLSKG